MKIAFAFAVALLLAISSCNRKTGAKSAISEAGVPDTLNHGYNELANPEGRTHFSISDFNRDNPDIPNIDRPQNSIINTELDTALLFGIWTSNPDGPHADFSLTGNSFYVVDYDGNGSLPYELTDNRLKIYYNDFILEGKVISVGKDTLQIMWKAFDTTNSYVRWRQ